jgi:hypothetical protein
LKKFRLPPDSKLRKAFPELWAWYDAHGYPNPHRPVHSALLLELIRRFSSLVQVTAVGWLGSPPNPGDPSDDLYLRLELLRERLRYAGLHGVASQLLLEVTELLKWLAPSSTDQQRQGILMTAFAASDPAVQKQVLPLIPRLLGNHRRGRHLTPKRLLWVKAYEENLRTGTELSWMKIAIKICDCGKATHTNLCRNNIRQGVRLLAVLLKKYQIHLPLRQAHTIASKP